MCEEEKKDILFEIDMQLYDEFNDTLATMYDHFGDIYSLRDIEEMEQAKKAKEIKLLRETVKNQQKEIEELKDRNKELNEALAEWINGERTSIFHIHKDEIKVKKRIRL